MVAMKTTQWNKRLGHSLAGKPLALKEWGLEFNHQKSHEKSQAWWLRFLTLGRHPWGSLANQHTSQRSHVSCWETLSQKTDGNLLRQPMTFIWPHASTHNGIEFVFPIQLPFRVSDFFIFSGLLTVHEHGKFKLYIEIVQETWGNFSLYFTYLL